MCASCVPELRFESGLLLTGESPLFLDIPDRDSHNGSKGHSYDPSRYVALSSQLTINDALISLGRFGEAKDEGLLASHLRGLLLVDLPHRRSVYPFGHNNVSPRTIRVLPGRWRRCVHFEDGLHTMAGLPEKRLATHSQA